MSSTAPTSTIDDELSVTAPTIDDELSVTATTIEDELSVRFLILDQLRGLMNSHGTLHVGVRPGERILTEKIVHDMKQYFIIKKPKEKYNSLDKTDVEQLEREYQVI
jgi:hypothetical protein